MNPQYAGTFVAANEYMLTLPLKQYSLAVVVYIKPHFKAYLHCVNNVLAKSGHSIKKNYGHRCGF